MRTFLALTSFLFFIISCTYENENANNIEQKNDSDSTTQVTTGRNDKNNKLTYDISIKELMDINVIDSTDIEYEPSYELSIKDLMQMKIVKELRMDTSLKATYDIPLEDLMKIEIQQKKGSPQIQPNYEMTMHGLLEWEIKEEYRVIDRIELSYEISLDGLMEIKIQNIEKKEIKKTPVQP